MQIRTIVAMGAQMNTDIFFEASDDYRKIEKAIQFIERHYNSRPDLDAIAQSIHMSKYHFDRLFKRWAGISPMQFLRFLTLDYTKQKLAESRGLLETSLEAGLSGPGRLHDLFVTFEAMTPGDFKRLGAGLTIAYGIHASPIGDCLIAVTGRGICYLGFVEADGREAAVNMLLETWPRATFIQDSARTAQIVSRIFDSRRSPDQPQFNLHLKGTNFQIHVWKALLSIPEGCLASYQDVAAMIGRPGASRAVASAVAANPVACLIPCHRVISKSGKIHQYRWGAARKKALVGLEAGRSAHPAAG